MKKQPNSAACFVCGIENPVGLNLAFWESGDRVYTRVRFDPPYQSYPGVAHGGLVTAVLDETLGRAVIGLRERVAMTAKLEVKFRGTVPLEAPLVASGWIDRERGRWYFASGELVVESTGERVVTVSGTFVALDDEQAGEMLAELPMWEVVPDAPSHRPPEIESPPD